MSTNAAWKNDHVVLRDKEKVDNANSTDHLKLLTFGSYYIDGVLLRVKTQDAREWVEQFLTKYSEVLPINIFIRMNPYRTLRILWMLHMRIALRGHSLEHFLEIVRILDEVEDKDRNTKFIEKGVRVIPLAPAWIPRNRVLVDLVLEYIAGRIDDEIAKKIFYSAFLKILRRKNIIVVESLTKWEPSAEMVNKEEKQSCDIMSP